VRRLLLASLLAVAAGCGSDDDEPGRTVTVGPSARVDVLADEYSFDPETLVAKAGELTISLKNEGALAHNLKVFDDGEEVGGTPTFQGGETRTGSVSLVEGEYELICTVGNHEQLGMTGKLEVR